MSEVVVLHGFAHGGEAVGRLADGCVVFVAHGLPGETVRLAVTDRRRRWARGRLLEVLQPSPDRVDPPCPYYGPPAAEVPRCGGCQLQHVAADRRRELLRQVVVDALEHIGRIVDPPVADTVAVREFGYRQRARFAVDNSGRLGFREAGSNRVVPIDRCLLLDAPTQGLRDRAGDEWRGASEVEVRAADDGDALVIHPGPGALAPLPDDDAAAALIDVHGDAVAIRGTPAVTHTVAGHAFRVSPGSFFQAGVAAAEVLAVLVRDAADVRPDDVALDLYAGVGLFAHVLAAAGAAVTAVEGGRSSAADAVVNLGDTAGVVNASVARFLAAAVPVDVAVLDPPRRGAGVDVVTVLAGLVRRRIVYVACDPAALARDARALAATGWRLQRAVPVDQFAQTAQIEVVATFDPPAPG